MMKCPHSKPVVGIILVLVVLGITFVPAAYAKDVPPKRPGKLVIPTVPDVAIPQSAFNIPSQPAEGRNPFFPQSVVKIVVPVFPRPDNTVDTASFILNGITSPPRRTAMINGRTFEPGEEGEVRLPTGGKMLIKVEEIKSDSAIILVGGQRRELRLRSGL
jgi:hypothetical protein